jgi:hypothetical protein
MPKKVVLRFLFICVLLISYDEKRGVFLKTNGRMHITVAPHLCVRSHKIDGFDYFVFRNFPVYGPAVNRQKARRLGFVPASSV